MKKTFFIILFFVSVFSLSAQDNYVKHTVAEGETVYSIAKKYQITPYDIYNLNPDSKQSITKGAVLLIPKSKSTTVLKHKVLSKETLFSIAKKYNTSVANLEKWNSDILKEGLKDGQEIWVVEPFQEEVKENNIKPIDIEEIKVTDTKKVTFSHTVLPQETKFGISQKYNLTIEELENLNPQIKEGLKIGEVLTIKTNIQSKETIYTTNSNANTYIVQSKETLYGICKRFKIKEEDLIKQNPELKDGLKEGMVLQIPASNQIKKDTLLYNKTRVDLFKSINKTKQKNLVMLLPFNVDKISNDTTKSKYAHLKNNKFLNLTLDFYSGVLMAIDSARVLGLPINVKIFDAQSTKTSSNVESLIKNNNIYSADAVIGPFQNVHAENAAQLLLANNVPVISPLSKETSSSYDNLYYAMPSDDFIKSSLINYFKKNNGNIIAIVSSKKNAMREYLQNNFANDVKIAALTERGGLDVQNLRSLMVKGKKNYVILDGESVGIILSTTGNLRSLQREYDVQMAMFELYETLDFDGIPISSLTSLKLMFPTVNKQNFTPEGRIFEKKYKKKNNIYPNAVAVKGFDITFDTMLRICTDEGFAQTAQKYRTEQAESAFDYVNINGYNLNNGVYIMYYDTDLTIKQAE